MGLFENLTGGVEAGSTEFDDEFLPLSGRVGSVLKRRMAFVAFRFPFVIPAVVDATHVAGAGIGFAVGVEDLDFVATLEVDAGVGAFGNEELGFDGAVAVFLKGFEVTAFFWIGGVGEEKGFRPGFGDDFLASGISCGGFLPTFLGFEDFVPFEAGGVEGESEE